MSRRAGGVIAVPIYTSSLTPVMHVEGTAGQVFALSPQASNKIESPPEATKREFFSSSAAPAGLSILFPTRSRH